MIALSFGQCPRGYDINSVVMKDAGRRERYADGVCPYQQRASHDKYNLEDVVPVGYQDLYAIRRANPSAHESLDVSAREHTLLYLSGTLTNPLRSWDRVKVTSAGATRRGSAPRSPADNGGLRVRPGGLKLGR